MYVIEGGGGGGEGGGGEDDSDIGDGGGSEEEVKEGELEEGVAAGGGDGVGGVGEVWNSRRRPVDADADDTLVGLSPVMANVITTWPPEPMGGSDGRGSERECCSSVEGCN